MGVPEPFVPQLPTGRGLLGGLRMAFGGGACRGPTGSGVALLLTGPVPMSPLWFLHV